MPDQSQSPPSPQSPPPAAPASVPARLSEGLANLPSAPAPAGANARPQARQPEPKAPDVVEEAAPETVAEEAKSKSDGSETIEFDDTGLPKTSEKAPSSPAKAPEPKTPKELRERYERLSKEHAELQEQLAARVKAKEDEVRETVLKNVPPPERLKELETALEEREKLIERTNFLKSNRYKQEFLAPYEKAVEHGVKVVSQLKVQDPDGSERKATAKDLARLTQMEIADAQTEALKLFGATAPYAMAERDRIVEAREKANEAGEAWEQNATRFQEEERQSQTRIVERFHSERGEVEKQYASHMPLDKEDKEATKLIEQSAVLADMAFGLGDEKLTEPQRLRVKAAVATRAKYFPALLRHYNTAKSRIAELEKRLEAVEESQPGRTEDTRPGGGKKEQGSVLDGVKNLPSVRGR